MIGDDMTVRQLLDQSEQIGAVVRLIGRDANDVPIWLVLAIKGDGAADYVAAIDAIETAWDTEEEK